MKIYTINKLGGGLLFEGADMTGAALNRANLHGMKLQGAKFRNADLSYADFSGTILYGADLRGANLTKAIFQCADMHCAKFEGAFIGDDILKRLRGKIMRLNDGQDFILFELENGPPKVRTIMRWMTIPEYREHIVKTYIYDDIANETTAILDYFEARMR